MSGAATTTQITTGRAAASIRREERRPFAIFGLHPVAHVFIFALACLIWWIARGMVNQTLTVDDAATVNFTLDESLRQSWAIVPQKTPTTVSVDLSGPNAEVNNFASQLRANRGMFSYVYRISPKDVERLTEDANMQVTLEADLSDFKEAGGTIKPAEVRILSPASGRKQAVKLERIISRDAITLVKERITGEIPGYTMRAKMQDGFELEVVGPASRIREISNEDGRPVLRIASVDVAMLVSNKGAADPKVREQILRDGFTENLDLVSVEGVSVRRKGADAAAGQVPVRFTFEAQRDFADTPAKDFPVSVRMAPWMIEKGVRIEGVPRNVTVLMEVLRRQLPDFNENNISVVLDLSRVQFSDLKNIEQPEGGGPGPRRARLSGLYFSLDINAEKLTYRFKRPDVTARQYVPAEEVRLAWTE